MPSWRVLSADWAASSVPGTPEIGDSIAWLLMTAPPSSTHHCSYLPFTIALFRITSGHREGFAMSSRAGLRFLQSSRLPLRSVPRKQPFGRRFQSSTAGEAPAQAAAHEAAEKVTPPSQNVLQRLWYSPVGMKTVHFWWVLLLLHHAPTHR